MYTILFGSTNSHTFTADTLLDFYKIILHTHTHKRVGGYFGGVVGVEEHAQHSHFHDTSLNGSLNDMPVKKCLLVITIFCKLIHYFSSCAVLATLDV